MKKLLFIVLATVLALSVGLVGCGGGGAGEMILTISSTSGGDVTTPGEGPFEYVPDKVVNLVATASAHAHFVNWTGDIGSMADPNDATTTITMSGNYSIVANFVEEPWDYNITLTIHYTIPAGSVITAVYNRWVGNITSYTSPEGGKFIINSITPGDLPFKAEDSLTAISAGVTDMGQLSGDTFHLAGAQNVPFLFPNMTSAAYTYWYLFQDAPSWDALNQLANVKIMLMSPLLPAEWQGKYNMTQPSDMSGQNIRAETADVPFVRACGGIPITVATSDIYTMLSGGVVIRGAFVTYPFINAPPGNLKLISNYTTELDLFPRPYFIAMNKAKYNSLCSAAQAALDSFSTLNWSVNLAQAHYDGYYNSAKTSIANYYLNVSHPGEIYIPSPAEKTTWRNTLNVTHGWWIGNMTALGYNGAGIYTRIKQLLLTAP